MKNRYNKSVFDIPATDEVKDKCFDDLVLWGLCATKTELESGKPTIRYVDPLSPEMQAAIYNAEHTDSFIEVRRYPLLPSDCYPIVIAQDDKNT